MPVANKCAALNRALEMLGGGLVFFADDDVRFSPQVLEEYSRAAQGVTHGCFFGGPTGVDYETAPPNWLKAYLPQSAVGWPEAGRVLDLADPSQIFLGFNWAAFADDIKQAGGFNPLRGPGSRTGVLGDESEMQQRLASRGAQKVFVPDALVWHYVPSERCSAQWALRRRYGGGLEMGAAYVYNGPRILGYPRWMWRRLAGTAFRLIWHALARDPVCALSRCVSIHRASRLHARHEAVGGGLQARLCSWTFRTYVIGILNTWQFVGR